MARWAYSEIKMPQLNFDYLFKQAISVWPNELDLSRLQSTTPEFANYTVKGLGMILDEIEELYIGKENEIIWRDLHCAIYEVLHAVAKFVLEFKVSAIRPESVRFIFERRLKTAASSQDLGWCPEDYEAVESYFSQNS